MQLCFTGRAYPGHGAVIEDGNARITQYIEHRKQREEEVLHVLRYGTIEKGKPEYRKAWSALELVKVIYHDVPENLHVPASYGVLQILKKLEREGKVEHDAATDRWALL